jgi:DNA modification methylase
VTAPTQKPERGAVKGSEQMIHPALRIRADARAIGLAGCSIDLCVTSPPYWKKRDYGHDSQIGLEATPGHYARSIQLVLREIRRVLKPTGSIFLNLGDTYNRGSLVGIPHLVEARARSDGWRVRNRIVWAKPNGVPNPHPDRLANRHETILHLTGPGSYFYDLGSLCELQGTRFPGGDIWEMPPARHLGRHPAPFPEDLVARAIALGCPEQVCRRCGAPRERTTTRGMQLDPLRPQARRALELARDNGLTRRHIAAIRATGISDAGKARLLQTGAGQNGHEVRKLAREAKKALGGYFREFTFAQCETTGFTSCRCAKGHEPGFVLDVFAGTGTTLLVAARMGRRSVGVDLLSWTTESRAKSPQRAAIKTRR